MVPYGLACTSSLGEKMGRQAAFEALFPSGHVTSWVDGEVWTTASDKPRAKRVSKAIWKYHVVCVESWVLLGEVLDFIPLIYRWPTSFCLVSPIAMTKPSRMLSVAIRSSSSLVTPLNKYGREVRKVFCVAGWFREMVGFPRVSVVSQIDIALPNFCILELVIAFDRYVAGFRWGPLTQKWWKRYTIPLIPKASHSCG